MTEHIVRAFEKELESLSEKIAQMGNLVEQQLVVSIESLKKKDVSLAEEVIASDRQVDALERDIEEQVIAMIARRQPMALDLREIIAAIRLSADLERIGDLSKNIARRVLAIGIAEHPQALVDGIENMSQLAVKQLRNVLMSFVDRDSEKAVSVWHNDATLNASYVSLLPELLTHMSENPANVTLCTHLLFAAKNMERIGDHVTNIAETIYYLVHGKTLIDEQSKDPKLISDSSL